MQYMFTGVILGNEKLAVDYLDENNLSRSNSETKIEWDYAFHHEDNAYDISLYLPSFPRLGNFFNKNRQ